ncbi:MAG: rod shape-determining protein RodA [Bacteroidetes bacterium]|nr:rod shape-determining protein RodA [Bacteroidota bacterium]
MSNYRNTPIQLGEIDKATLGMYIALVSIGWLMIFAVNYDPQAPYAFFNLSSNTGKQLFFMVLCFVLVFVILMTDWVFWRTYGFIIYLLTLLLLPGTLLLGHEVNGAYAWYQVGGFSFQPSELAKFGTCLAMAGFLSSAGIDLRHWRNRFFAFGIFLLPVGIILIQQDTGSALVFFSFLLVLYREGLSPVWYILGFGSAAMVILGLIYEPPLVASWLMLALNFRLINRFREHTRAWWVAFVISLILLLAWTPVFEWLLSKSHIEANQTPFYNYWIMLPHGLLLLAAFLASYLRKNNLVQRQLLLNLLVLVLASGLAFAANFACYTVLAPHQQLRIKIWLKPAEAAAEARGSAYNLLHSKMAIGSGGFGGKGFLDGNMTKLKYVPEQSTDFIFCTIGEEQGFVGVAAIIALFTLLLYRITVLAERQRSNFSRTYAYSVAGIIFIHFLVNIGMTMGLFPIIGIPLPFISYGGSSLIGFTLMIGVLLKLDSHRNQA